MICSIILFSLVNDIILFLFLGPIEKENIHKRYEKKELKDNHTKKDRLIDDWQSG